MRFIILFALISLGLCALGDRVVAAPIAKPRTADEIAAARLQLDTEQTSFNRALEEKKLEIERMKAWITGVSLMVPLMVAAITFALGVWNQNQQAKLAREAQRNGERAEFELKAADIAFKANGPIGVKNRAKALKALFPGRLPSDFVVSFDPQEFEGPRSESYDAKKIFFQAAVENPAEIPRLTALWKRLFPGDKWPDRIDGNFEASNKPASET